MTSRQLSELTPQELVDHTNNILTEAKGARRRAGATVMAGPIEVPTKQDPPHPTQRAVEAATAAYGWAERALETTSPASAASFREQAIAYLDIIHRQQILGEWSWETNQDAVEKLRKASKLSKRRFRKNKTKTKTRRRRHKNTKRRRTH